MRPAAQAGAVEVLGLGEVEHLAAGGDRGEHLVGGGQVVAGDDRRPGARDVLEPVTTGRKIGTQHRRDGEFGGAVQHAQNLPSGCRPASSASDARNTDRWPRAADRRSGNTSYLCCEIHRHRNRVLRQAGRHDAAHRRTATRDAVARLVQESGPLTAAALAERLRLSAGGDPPASRRAGRRRHPRRGAAAGLPLRPRGRGRPARTYALTEPAGRRFPHAYDDLAKTALRYLRGTAGTPRWSPSPSTGRVAGRTDRGPAAKQPTAPPRPIRHAGRAGRRGADRAGLRRRVEPAGAGRPDLSAPLPGRPRRGRVPRTVRGRDPGAVERARYLRPATGHDRPRRRGLHHARPRSTAPERTIDRPSTEHA